MSSLSPLLIISNSVSSSLLSSLLLSWFLFFLLSSFLLSFSPFCSLPLFYPLLFCPHLSSSPFHSAFSSLFFSPSSSFILSSLLLSALFFYLLAFLLLLSLLSWFLFFPSAFSSFLLIILSPLCSSPLILFSLLLSLLSPHLSSPPFSSFSSHLFSAHYPHHLSLSPHPSSPPFSSFSLSSHLLSFSLLIIIFFSSLILFALLLCSTHCPVFSFPVSVSVQATPFLVYFSLFISPFYPPVTHPSIIHTPPHSGACRHADAAQDELTVLLLPCDGKRQVSRSVSHGSLMG